MKQRCEKVSWEQIKQDCKIYDADDNNDGLIYGVHLYEHCEDYQDIVDAVWFKTEEERDVYIKENDLFVI